MSGAGEGGEPGREALLDATPEAVAMRRARAAWAAAREAPAKAPPARPWRRRAALGALMAWVALARALGRSGRGP